MKQLEASPYRVDGRTPEHTMKEYLGKVTRKYARGVKQTTQKSQNHFKTPRRSVPDSMLNMTSPVKGVQRVAVKLDTDSK